MATRTHYEREADRVIEDNAKEWLATFSGAELWKLSESVWVVDWALGMKNRIMYFAEYKRRYNTIDQYKNYRVSAAKILKMKELAGLAGQPSRFFLQLNDRFLVHRIDKNYTIENLVPFGINPPRDDMDIEPACEIEWSKFDVLYDGCVTDPYKTRPSKFLRTEQAMKETREYIEKHGSG